MERPPVDWAKACKVALTLLFTRKGLYQNVLIGPDDATPEELGRLKQFPIQLSDPEVNFSGGKITEVKLPAIHLQCCDCLLHTTHIGWKADVMQRSRQGDQYLCRYRCAACQDGLVLFLVRLKDRKLQLTGRSVVLRERIPHIIPKGIRVILQDAWGAVGEGDVYAGFYHLRTFLEHYMKNELSLDIAAQTQGTDLWEQYKGQLDRRLLDGFPSLGKIYEDLSGRLHARTGDAKDFEASAGSIYSFFRAKELFREFPLSESGTESEDVSLHSAGKSAEAVEDPLDV